MTHNAPLFGLLLDVDGPLANPITRRVDITSIPADIVTMANAGIPIALNTGRSLPFIDDTVIPVLTRAGLGAHARIYSIAEKGGVWARITTTGHSDTHTDPAIALDPHFVDAMRALIASTYTATMFFDETKETMLSAEMVPGISFDDYYPDQAAFNARALAELRSLGYGVTLDGVEHPDSNGAVQVRIEPTIISTDIELLETGKALGAKRALELFGTDGPIPDIWYTVGDSRSDYTMADWLHTNGYTVTHMDVRPSEPLPETPYRVRTHDGVINDESAAILLHELADSISRA